MGLLEICFYFGCEVNIQCLSFPVLLEQLLSCLLMLLEGTSKIRGFPLKVIKNITLSNVPICKLVILNKLSFKIPRWFVGFYYSVVYNYETHSWPYRSGLSVWLSFLDYLLINANFSAYDCLLIHCRKLLYDEHMFLLFI
jgi:hypothetical protein